MRKMTRTGLMVLTLAAPLAVASMLSTNSSAHSQEFMLGQGLMMVQGDMDPGRLMGGGGPMGVMRSLSRMMDPSRMMGAGDMGGMMDEQQMREMTEQCNEMMDRYVQEDDQSAARQ